MILLQVFVCLLILAAAVLPVFLFTQSLLVPLSSKAGKALVRLIQKRLPPPPQLQKQPEVYAIYLHILSTGQNHRGEFVGRVQMQYAIPRSQALFLMIQHDAADMALPHFNSAYAADLCGLDTKLKLADSIFQELPP